MDEPTTPAALPRNREADAWRERYDRSGYALAAAVVVAFCLGGKCIFLLLDADMRAARAQVAAAEQRAEMAEARLRVAEDHASARGAWHCGNVSVVCFDETSCVCAITSTPRRKP